MRAVTLIPGASEFGYDTAVVSQMRRPRRPTAPENRHVAEPRHRRRGVARPTCRRSAPTLERVALVVTWFGDDLRAGHCTHRARGSRPRASSTTAIGWAVAGLTRARRRVRCRRSTAGRPMAARRPTSSVIRAIRELKARGLKVTLYPFVMMDVPAGQRAARSVDRHGAAARLSLARPHHLPSRAGPAGFAGRHRRCGDAGGDVLRHRQRGALHGERRRGVLFRARRVDAPPHGAALRGAGEGRRRGRRLPDRLGDARR